VNPVTRSSSNRIRIDAAAVPRLKRAASWFANGVGYDVVDREACGAAASRCATFPTTHDRGCRFRDRDDDGVCAGTVTYDAALRADLKTGWSHVHNVTSRRCAGRGSA